MLVDVRHEASHNELPSLPLLRLASAAAIDWLKLAYWTRQTEHIQNNQHRVFELLQASYLHTCGVSACKDTSLLQVSSLWALQSACHLSLA